MRHLVLALAACSVLSFGKLSAEEFDFSTAAEAIEQEAPSANPELTTSEKTVSSTPDADSIDLVQKNAMVRTEQRMRRLESSRWFGVSNSRPIASSLPYMTHYSPTWVVSPWTTLHWYWRY